MIHSNKTVQIQKIAPGNRLFVYGWAREMIDCAKKNEGVFVSPAYPETDFHFVDEGRAVSREKLLIIYSHSREMGRYAWTIAHKKYRFYTSDKNIACLFLEQKLMR
jgi:hypothetical protein